MSGSSWRNKAVALGEGCHPRAAAVLMMLGIEHEELLDIIGRLKIAGDIDILYDACGGSLYHLAIVLVCADVEAVGLSKEKLAQVLSQRGAGLNVRTVVAHADEVAEHMTWYHNPS